MAVRPTDTLSTSSEDQGLCDGALPIVLIEERLSEHMCCIRPADIPHFSGRLADYPIYRMRVRALWKSVMTSDRAVLIRELVDRLPGGCRQAFGVWTWPEFGGTDGLQLFWTVFTSRYAWSRETVLRQAVTGYLTVEGEWQRGETLREFLRHFKKQEHAFVDCVQECLQHEARLVFRQDMTRYVEERRRWTRELQEWHMATVANRETEAMDEDDAPLLRELLVKPVKPIMPAAPNSVLFWWPEVLSGCVLVARLALHPESQAQLVQAAGGSFQYPALARALLTGSIFDVHPCPSGSEPKASMGIMPKEELQEEALCSEAAEQPGTQAQVQSPSGYGTTTLDPVASSLLEAALTSQLTEDAVALVAYITNARDWSGTRAASSSQPPGKRTRTQ